VFSTDRSSLTTERKRSGAGALHLEKNEKERKWRPAKREGEKRGGEKGLFARGGASTLREDRCRRKKGTGVAPVRPTREKKTKKKYSMKRERWEGGGSRKKTIETAKKGKRGSPHRPPHIAVCAPQKAASWKRKEEGRDLLFSCANKERGKEGRKRSCFVTEQGEKGGHV